MRNGLIPVSEPLQPMTAIFAVNSTPDLLGRRSGSGCNQTEKVFHFVCTPIRVLRSPREDTGLKQALFVLSARLFMCVKV